MASAIELHADAGRQAEHEKQAVMVPDVSAAAAKAADIAYHRARYASALATGCSPSVSVQALRALGVEPTEPVVPAPAPPPEVEAEGVATSARGKKR